jgi:hypothetical protein
MSKRSGMAVLPILLAAKSSELTRAIGESTVRIGSGCESSFFCSCVLGADYLLFGGNDKTGAEPSELFVKIRTEFTRCSFLEYQRKSGEI